MKIFLVFLRESNRIVFGLVLAVCCFIGMDLDAQISESERLHSLFAEEWERSMEENPDWASSLGDRRWNDRWTDLSLGAFDRRQEGTRAALTRLKTIDREALSPEDGLNFDLFKKRAETQLEESEWRWHLVVLNQRGGIQTQNELADGLRFQTIQDYEDWLERLRSFPHYMDQTMELMREGIRRRILLPKVTMLRVPLQIDAQIVSHPADSPFFDPFERMPKTIIGDDRERLLKRGRDAVTGSVVPSYRRFKTFFENEYLPACFDGVGIWQVPGGRDMYAFFARKYTTTNLTPDEIHEIGLSEVARILAEMQRVKELAGYSGTLPEFFNHLRTDPQFFYASGDELLAATRTLCKRIDPMMIQLFTRLPRMPYGVEPVPDAVAPDTTTAYYRRPAADGSRAGSYFVNLYRPETRPKWEMMALTLHEAVPGHHFQIALAMELGKLPSFRRYTGQTAFIEGWGLYSEYLGEELGLYENPYDKFGQLTYEMWRAVRLVVDTGIHTKQWTRQQAIEYFKAHAPKMENDIVNEVDRYISWPGQALAYKMGELKIKELRKRVEAVLGDRFDVREFHDQLLSGGAVPLDVLEQRMEEWLEIRGGS